MTVNNETAGKRLKECLKLRNMSQRQLIREVKENTEKAGKTLEIDPAHLSKYISGSLHIPEDKLREIASVLRIPYGYFTLDDVEEGDACDSYTDYLEKKMVEANTEIVKYNKLLKPAGIMIKGFVDGYLDGIPQSFKYIVTYYEPNNQKSYSLNFNEKEMESFYQELCKRLHSSALDIISGYDQKYFTGEKLDKTMIDSKTAN